MIQKKQIGMRMKGLLAAAVILSLSAFSACGQETPTQTTSASENQIKGTITDAGKISALCPDGWQSVGLPDLSAESPDTPAADGLRFVKGGTDLNHNAFVELRYYSSEKEIPETDASKWYDNVTGTGNVNTGSFTWSGYSGQSMGVPFVYLETVTENAAFTAYLYTQENGAHTASLYDADVQAILASVQKSSEQK